MSLDLTEENGCIEVDTAIEPPLLVFLAGPIKHWWGVGEDGQPAWGSAAHQEYSAWRDSVRRALVKTGKIIVYSPHRALQGAWHPRAQAINDAAIQNCDVFLYLTPVGVPGVGTHAEMALADHYYKPTFWAPPGDDEYRDRLVRTLLRIREHRLLYGGLLHVG